MKNTLDRESERKDTLCFFSGNGDMVIECQNSKFFNGEGDGESCSFFSAMCWDRIALGCVYTAQSFVSA